MNGKDHKVLFVGEEQCNTQPCMKKKKYKRIKRVVILVSALALIIIGLGIFSVGSDDLVKQLQEEQEMDELARKRMQIQYITDKYSYGCQQYPGDDPGDIKSPWFDILIFTYLLFRLVVRIVLVHFLPPHLYG